MKKRLTALITAGILTLSAIPAGAANGDIVGDVYNTDILTVIDGVPIVSYSIDGQTVIPLEELEKYGYVVYYNDDIRTVFVTHAGDIPDRFNPEVYRGTVGGTNGYIYESDIKAYLNGVPIKTYALNGQVAAVVEDIGYMAGNGSMGERYRMSNYGFNFDYYNSSRLLSLKTRLNRFPDPKAREELSVRLHGKSWKQDELYEFDGYDIMTGAEDSASYDASTIEYFGQDHLYIDISSLLKDAFNFVTDSHGNLKVSLLNAKDGVISFKGTRKKGQITEESGTYEMEIPRLALTKVK